MPEKTKLVLEEPLWENWRKELSIEEVFAPVKDKDKRNKCIELFNELRKNEGNTQQVATA